VVVLVFTDQVEVDAINDQLSGAAEAEGVVEGLQLAALPTVLAELNVKLEWLGRADECLEFGGRGRRLAGAELSTGYQIAALT
jgi:hypothetical protein